MPHCRYSRYFAIKAPKRSQFLDRIITRLRFGARFHAKTPLIPLPQPSGLQNDIFSEKVFASRFRRCSSVCRRTFLVFSLHPLTATLRAEKRHGFLDFLEKFLRCVFTDGLKVVGGLAFISPSTPLQQHGGPKNDTVFQKIFLPYNRSLHPSKNDIQFCFLENFLYYLNNNMEGPENDDELQLFQKVSLLSYRNIEWSFFKSPFHLPTT